MTTTRIKALIFDFDGVIHDSFDINYRINNIIHHHELPDISIEEYKDMHDGNIYGHKRVTDEGTVKFFELFAEEFKELKIQEEIKKELELLKKKYGLFIISSNKEMILNNYLFNNQATHLFTQIFGLETHKSKLEKFGLLQKRYGLQKEECLFVTDTLGDLMEAKMAGISSIAVDFGFHDAERLKKGEPLHIISQFSELREILEKIDG